MYYQLALFGNPVAHSLSPWIHREFARQLGLKISYDAHLVPEGQFNGVLEQFLLQGGVGANVTLPLKQEAVKICSRLSSRAKLAGAVNTLKRLDNQTWYGDNTDGAGLIQDLDSAGFKVKESRILLIGAGGAARGIIQPLLEEMPRLITLTNRTFSKAESLAYEFKISALPLNDLDKRRYDLIINATSAGLKEETLPLNPQIFSDCVLAYDLVYGPKATFFKSAVDAGLIPTFRDGLGMLVYQAAASFALWTRLTPDVAPVLASLRQTISPKG